MPEQINSNRRGFLTRLSKPVKAAASYEEKSQRLRRIRRAVDEVLFERLCNGCGLCDKTSNDVIEMLKGSALLNLDYNSCSLCDKCIEVCPTGALHQTVAYYIDLSLALLIAVTITCKWIAMRVRPLVPAGAIHIEVGELPTVAQGKCNGCGECRSACYGW